MHRKVTFVVEVDTGNFFYPVIPELGTEEKTKIVEMGNHLLELPYVKHVECTASVPVEEKHVEGAGQAE